MPDIIVNADDFGISVNATRRILDSHLTGSVNRVSILANGSAFEFAAEQLKKLPELRYAVHLNLVEGKAISRKELLPYLVNAQGYFKHSFLSLWLLYKLRRSKRAELIRQITIELKSQIDKVRCVLNCKHISVDGHQYIHLLPFIFNLLNDLSEEWGIAGIRIPVEPFFLIKPIIKNIANFFSLNIIKYIVVTYLAKKAIRSSAKKNIRYSDYFIGLLFSGKMSIGVVKAAISKLCKDRGFSDSKIEILFHPGQADKDEAYIWKNNSRLLKFYTGRERVHEYNSLISRNFKDYIDLLRSNNINTAKQITNWIAYWNNDIIFSDILERAAHYFIKNTRSILQYSPYDILLDIGCGPGYVEDILKNEVKEIHGLDVSERYIRECKNKFADTDNVFFYKLEENNYLDFSLLKSKRFSIIICLSVIQYYKDIKEVEDLIWNVKSVAKRGAHFLIADIPMKNKFISDIFSLIKLSISKNFFTKVIKFLLRSRFSFYYKVRSTHGLLLLSDHEIMQLIERMGLKAKLLKEPLTLCRGRNHILIQF